VLSPRRGPAGARPALLLCCALLSCAAALGRQYDPAFYSGMRWRLIGPHRAGRVTAVAGIPGRPAVYYMGTPGGGMWKTTDGGQVWKPVFDGARVASVGALALAPSNPEIIYVGTGEEAEGDGVYRSADGGATWQNVGLRETHYITSIIVDPRDPNVVIVGAFGDSGVYRLTTPGQARGVFKTTDGGKTWSRTLFKDEKTGVVDMCAAPGDGRVIYAALATRRSDPDEKRPEQEGLIFKSADGGSTWQPAGTAGLPEKFQGRIGVAAAPGGRRVYAIMSQGFFRSDDGGATWAQVTKDPRVVGSGFFSRTFVDPRDADTVYVMQTSTYRSTDGGRTFEAWRGTPSGEDDHVLWIAPEDSKRMLMGTDQGAIVTLNGGESWSLWFNQPTGQFYHVTTDEQFPYFMYAAQQDSGSVAVPERGNMGQITYREWFPTGAFESGYIAPDPSDPNLVYSIGWYGTAFRLDRTTGQVSTLFIPGPGYRYTWETPLVFSPADKRTLYVGMQKLLRSGDGALTWREVSPDLTEKPAAAGAADREPARGTIEAIAPSPLRAEEIWVGTSTGLVQLTRDGGATWQNVTPPEMPARGHVTRIEASHFDAEAAYAVASAPNDVRPYVFRTRDAGKSWQKVVAGLPARGVARVVREDPARKGLAYAGTETGAFVSFDGGDRWQPLQLNLPTTSVRDLAVHGDDLVAATDGRGLWVLDGLSPLRQMDAKSAGEGVHLFRPAHALRVRFDNQWDTPLSAETPAGENPPDGAVIDYYLKSPPAKEITLEIRDARGAVVRRYSSTPPPPDDRPRNVPDLWFAPPAVLTTKAGVNRFVWDLRYADPPTLPYNFYGARIDYVEYTLPVHAVAGLTPRQQPQGALVAPGTYEVVLTVAGKTYRQPLVVEPDPRARATPADLEAQFALAKKVSDMMATSYNSYNRAASLRAALAAGLKGLPEDPRAKEAAGAAAALDKELAEIMEGTQDVAGFGSVNRDLARYLTMVESGDVRPTESARGVVAESCESLAKALVRWGRVNAEAVPALNALLTRHKLAPLPAEATGAADLACGN
jgi:photosystem II stability/assembly factor-like uncharacterized protein